MVRACQASVAALLAELVKRFGTGQGDESAIRAWRARWVRGAWRASRVAGVFVAGTRGIEPNDGDPNGDSDRPAGREPAQNRVCEDLCARIA